MGKSEKKPASQPQKPEKKPTSQSQKNSAADDEMDPTVTPFCPFYFKRFVGEDFRFLWCKVGCNSQEWQGNVDTFPV